MIIRCRKQDFPLVKVELEEILFLFKDQNVRDEMHAVINDSSTMGTRRVLTCYRY